MLSFNFAKSKQNFCPVYHVGTTKETSVVFSFLTYLLMSIFSRLFSQKVTLKESPLFFSIHLRLDKQCHSIFWGGVEGGLRVGS